MFVWAQLVRLEKELCGLVLMLHQDHLCRGNSFGGQSARGDYLRGRNLDCVPSLAFDSELLLKSLFYR